MAKFATVEEAIRYNSNKICKVKGCGKQRDRVSGYCYAHNKRSSMTGSPTLGNIYPYKHPYYRERSIAEQIIEVNKKTHKGVQYALKFFASIIENVKSGTPQYGLTPVARDSLSSLIMKMDIRPEDMLEVASAYYAYTSYEPTLLTDRKYFNTQLGTQLLKTVRHMAQPTGRDKRKFSEYIQKQLGVILVNLSDGILKRMKQEDTVFIVQSEPINTDF